MAKLDAQLPPNRNVTVVHLGRGGVQEDGTLDAYNKGRVEQTLRVVSAITSLRPRAKVQVIWTGGHNRKLDRSDTKPSTSEGDAALRHATELVGPDSYTMLSEAKSTSTVENATACAALIPADDTIVVVTDPLHYVSWKVQFIFWLTYPGRRIVFVELSLSPPGTTHKKVAVHLVSTFITMAGMIGVRRGNPAAIQHRQVRLQKYTGH